MKGIKFLTFLFMLTTFFMSISYGVKPYNERPDDFTARVEWNIEFVTNYTPPWHLPNEEKKPLTGIKYHYTLFYDTSNKRKFASILAQFERGRDIADDFLYVRGMCSNNNIIWTGVPFVMRHDYDPSTGRLTKVRPEKERIVFLDLDGTTKLDGTIVRRWFVDFRVSDGTGLMTMDESEGFMPPGGRLDFEIIVKGEKTMPGVLDLGGWRQAAHWVFRDAGDAPPGFSIPTGAKVFKVVGPVVKPFPSDGPLVYIEKLMKITREAYDLGWINKQDVYDGLNDKLVAARENIKKGWWNYHTARNIMEAYKHLLEAQRGKAIDEMAYRMLYYDANELVGMLK
jgi:hypothetical protein